MSLLHSAVPFAIIWKAWGYSSAGRAFEWHSKGQRFDPAYLHHVFNPPHLSDVVLFIHSPHRAYRTFRVGFYTDEVRHCLVSSVFYLFPKKIKGGQNELVKSPKMIAMTALIRVISF